MTINYKKILSISFLLLFFLVLSATFTQHKVKADAYQDKFIQVTPSDLANAGYTGVTQQSQDGVNYQLPNLYFWINNATEQNPKADGNFDLLMVSQYTNSTPYTSDLFSYGTNTTEVSVSGAKAQEAELGDDREVLNFSKGDYYFVIIGLNASKVEALANIIAQKI